LRTGAGTHMWTAPVPQEFFDGLIGSLASICPACWCGLVAAGQDGFPRCEFQTPQRPLQANGSHGFSRTSDRSILPSVSFCSSGPTGGRLRRPA